ncbi:MAG: AEC family transporter [Desulfobacterales bacterium]
MQILGTIIPIFVIIALGWFARRKAVMPPEFLEPANHLVYHLAIPAMIFRAVSGSSLKTQFDPAVVAITLFAALTVFAAAWAAGRLLRLLRSRRGTFIQNSIHGNLGYIGLAVAFYYLGNEGFVRAGIIAGFLIILQNFLAVSVLQLYSNSLTPRHGHWTVFWKVAGNPIILAALLGIIFSLFAIPLPLIVDRSLKILSDLALPMALLIIGASLSFNLMRRNLAPVLVTTGLKLVLLPAVGLIAYRLAGVQAVDYLPGLILLASPTATVTYVMAREMRGDAEFAVAAISASTLLSALTFTVWLNLAG